MPIATRCVSHVYFERPGQRRTCREAGAQSLRAFPLDRQPGCRREIASRDFRFCLLGLTTCEMQGGMVVRFKELGGAEEASREAAPSQIARLLIADDHALVREGLRTMLSDEDGLTVVAEANNGQEALSICRQERPD